MDKANISEMLGLDLYQKVRAGFVGKGTTLTAWAKSKGVTPQNLRSALTGGWNGPKAQSLAKQAVEASDAQSR